MKVPTTKLEQKRAFVALYAVSIAFWLSLVAWREVNQRDAVWMRQTYFSDVPLAGDMNGWAIGHFLHYLALGFAAPDLWPYAAVLGVGFELLEIPMGMYLSKYIDSRLVEDTVVNTSGLLIGVALRRAFKF